MSLRPHTVTTVTTTYAGQSFQDYVSAALLAATGASAGVLATVIYNYLTTPAPMLRHPPTFTKAPLVVTVTGAAGQIGYSIIYMIGQGRMLGADQPIHLRLLDLPPMQPVLNGVAMELDDCAFPIISSVVCTADYQTAFDQCDIALLIGARPRGPGMDRSDLLKANAAIFEGQGKALNAYAKRTVKVLVVGNPANTNALIASHYAPDLPKSAFTAMTRLDQNRAVGQLAKRANVPINAVHNVVVWGNHSNTQYPDVTSAYIDGGAHGGRKSVNEVINDGAWIRGDFIKTVQTRGAAIIEALKKSSAASAANAAIDHIHDWHLGTAPGEYVSMAVSSDNNPYNVPAGLIFSFPCECSNGEWRIVPDLKIDSFSQDKLVATAEELQKEKADAFASAAAPASTSSTTTAPK